MLKIVEESGHDYRDQELRQVFNELNKEKFGDTLPPVDEFVWTRDTLRAGQYKCWIRGGIVTRCRISISMTYKNEHGMNEMRLTMLHEMCHHWERVMYGSTSDSSWTFHNKLREVGAPAEAKAISVSLKNYKYIYQCADCGVVWGANRIWRAPHFHRECVDRKEHGYIHLIDAR